MNICIDMHDYAGQRSIVMLNENDLFDLILYSGLIKIICIQVRGLTVQFLFSGVKDEYIVYKPTSNLCVCKPIPSLLAHWDSSCKIISPCNVYIVGVYATLEAILIILLRRLNLL